MEASARISNSRFLWNTAGTGGGLLVTARHANATVEVLQSVFAGNAATNDSGGAVYIYT